MTLDLQAVEKGHADCECGDGQGEREGGLAMCREPDDALHEIDFHSTKDTGRLFPKRQQGLAQFTLFVGKRSSFLRGTVGRGNVGVACRGKIVFDDGGYGLHEVARFFRFFRDLGCGESEVVENEGRFTAETGHDGVDHVVERLACLLRLQLGERKVFAEVFERDVEVACLDGGFHELDVGNSAFGGPSEIVEQFGAVEVAEGVGDAVGRLGHINAFRHEIFHLGSGPTHKFGKTNHHLATKERHRALIQYSLLKTTGGFVEFLHTSLDICKPLAKVFPFIRVDGARSVVELPLKVAGLMA